MNFTFGGFAYRGDVENLDYINDGTVITSRNQSVDPQSNNGISRYNGWQILEIKDNNGNIITSETEINKKLANLANEKVYVTKLVHAGSPENFVYCNTEVSGDPQRAVYILSSGKKYNNFNTYKPRNWDMYIDKNQKELIKEVHAMEYEEAPEKGNSLRYISSSYWLATVGTGRYLRYLQDEAHDWGDGWLDRCYGIRPVITLKDGVYIASGYGVVGNEYVLAKE